MTSCSICLSPSDLPRCLNTMPSRLLIHYKCLFTKGLLHKCRCQGALWDSMSPRVSGHGERVVTRIQRICLEMVASQRRVPSGCGPSPAQSTGINTLGFVANLCPMFCQGSHLNKPHQKPDGREPIEESTQLSLLEQNRGGKWILGNRQRCSICVHFAYQTVNSWKTSTFNQSGEARLFA